MQHFPRRMVMMSKEFWSVYCPKNSCLLLTSGWWECLSASLGLGSVFRNGNSAGNRPVFWDRSGCSEAVRYKSAVKEVFSLLKELDCKSKLPKRCVSVVFDFAFNLLLISSYGPLDGTKWKHTAGWKIILGASLLSLLLKAFRPCCHLKHR